MLPEDTGGGGGLLEPCYADHLWMLGGVSLVVERTPGAAPTQKLSWCAPLLFIYPGCPVHICGASVYSRCGQNDEG